MSTPSARAPASRSARPIAPSPQPMSTTVRPAIGSACWRASKSFMSVAPRHAQDVLADVGLDEVVGDRRDLVEPRLAELALDVVLLGEAEAAVRVDAYIGRLPGRLGGQVLGHVGLGAARLLAFEARARLPAHQVGGLDRHVRLRDRELHTLVGADRLA